MNEENLNDVLLVTDLRIHMVEYEHNPNQRVVQIRQNAKEKFHVPYRRYLMISQIKNQKDKDVEILTVIFNFIVSYEYFLYRICIFFYYKLI